MGTYFIELRWNLLEHNNLLQPIHQVTIDFRFRQSLTQERFSLGILISNHSIVYKIMKRFFEVYDTDGLVYEVSE